jgi:hypothetical protein
MLPSEADLRARQQVRRTHGAVLRGWYWSDSRSAPATGHPERATGDYEDDEGDEGDEAIPERDGSYAVPPRPHSAS